MRFEVQGFSLRRKDTQVPFLENVSCEVEAGMALGIVGSNGSGKSLLVQAWMGWAPRGVEGRGFVSFNHHLLHDEQGPHWPGLAQVIGREIGVILGDPGTHLNPALTALEQLTRSCRLQPGGPSMEERLDVVHLDPKILRRYPAYLSSGQRQRVALACSVLRQGLLLCDDPVVSLDPILRAQFFQYLASRLRLGQIGVIILTARESDLPSFVDRVAYLPDQRENRDSPHKLDLGLPARPLGSPVLEVKKLAVSREGRHVLRGIDLLVRSGEIVAIVGESGAGKSTLLEAVVRTIPVEPASEIRALGRNLTRLKPDPHEPDSPKLARLRRRLRIAFQDPASLFDPNFTTDRVFALFPWHGSEPLPLADALKTRLAPSATSSIGELGGWDRRALALWVALDPKTKILLADEPFADADDEHLQMLLHGFRELAEQGTGLLLVTHHLRVAASVAHRVVVLHRGVIVEILPGKKLMTMPRHPYTRLLVSATLDPLREPIEILSGSGLPEESCGFVETCHRAKPKCRGKKGIPPAWATEEVRCWFPHETPLRSGAASASTPIFPLSLPPADIVCGCDVRLPQETTPSLCVADGEGRIYLLEGESWRKTVGEEEEILGEILLLRGLTPRP